MSITTSGTGTRLAWRPLQRSTRVAILGALVATVAYQLFLLTPAYRGIWWLWTATVVAEGLTAFHAIGTWWTILAHDDRPEPANVTVWRNRLRAGAPVPTIDVFITACGEPPELVRATMRAARDMRLTHRTWVLDDGGSDELRRLCVEERVGYLRRADRAHAKAGNVNAGLARTNGEYVVIFDADHVPEPEFLVEILPHFQDPEVAFVQSPQYYTNRVNLVSSGTIEAQRIFYELVCPGKNRFNAAFCVGTNVMFRRTALADIRGISVGTNSEDIWTSLALHRRGWKSIYVPNVLARGLAPEDVGTYLRQQRRWAGGGFEILLRGRLFRRRTGLSVDQRLQYLFCGTHYLLSVAMSVFMLLPAMYLLFGLSPIRANGWTWATHYLPFYAMTLLVTWLQSGGFRLSAIVASIGSAPVHVRALWLTLRGGKSAWRATNSHDGGRSLWVVMPHVALLLLNVTAIAVGLTVMADPAPTWLCVGWASMHALILGRMIIAALAGRSRRPATEPAVPDRTNAASIRTTDRPALVATPARADHTHLAAPALSPAAAGRVPAVNPFEPGPGPAAGGHRAGAGHCRPSHVEKDSFNSISELEGQS
jgi:cellulose synthase (UDP-forming)